MPRRDDRFLTTALSCPVGEVVDVSRSGFRLRALKRPPLKTGQTHEIVLRAGGQQVRVAARVQWVKRTRLVPARYELGFLIVDHRTGIGVAVQQLGQFGCIGGPVDADQSGAPSPAAGNQPPRGQGISAAVQLEDLYALLGVQEQVSADELKRAYRTLARTVHPDHSTAPDAAAQFDRIAKAYAILGDPTRRKWYDDMRRGDAA